MVKLFILTEDETSVTHWNYDDFIRTKLKHINNNTVQSSTMTFEPGLTNF